MKKWKVSLVIVVLLLAGVGGAGYYLLNVKEYKIADAKVEKLEKNDYKITLPNGNDAGTNQQGLNQDGAGGISNTAATKEGGRTALALENGSSASAGTDKFNHSSVSSAMRTGKILVTAQKETVTAIIAKYQPVFQDLENQANSKLNSLLSDASNEYKTKKTNGEGISYLYFYGKYHQAAKTIEANTDASFNIIYNALVKELKQSGYSANEAKPIRTQYENIKKQLSSDLLEKAMARF